MFGAGYFWEVERGFSIEPSFMLGVITHNKTMVYDIGIKSHHNFRSFYGWLGVCYRSGIDTLSENKVGIGSIQSQQQLSLMMGMQKGAFSLSYAYTHGLERIQLSNFAGHLFTLGIDIFDDAYRPTTIRGIL